MNEPRMPALLTSSGRPGFYFRVLREGEVGAGDGIEKGGEANERMTVAEINALLYSPNHPHQRLRARVRGRRPLPRAARVVRSVTSQPDLHNSERQRRTHARCSCPSSRIRISRAYCDGHRT